MFSLKEAHRLLSLNRFISQLRLYSNLPVSGHFMAARNVSDEVKAMSMKHFSASAVYDGVTWINSEDAASLDRLLMDPDGPVQYTLEQLMGLAVQAVADAIAHRYTPIGSDDKHHYGKTSVRHVYVACGPGNNGGDGLVAARHLHTTYGFPLSMISVVLPRAAADKSYNDRLLKQWLSYHQSESSSVFSPLSRMPQAGQLAAIASDGTVVVVDAIFGFSFNGANGVREPYATMISEINHLKASCGVHIVCVDVPSGWDVNTGPTRSRQPYIESPDVLVSLTLPKLGVREHLLGTDGNPIPHYLGGRGFVPTPLAQALGLTLPHFEGDAKTIRLK